MGLLHKRKWKHFYIDSYKDSLPSSAAVQQHLHATSRQAGVVLQSTQSVMSDTKSVFLREATKTWYK